MRVLHLPRTGFAPRILDKFVESHRALDDLKLVPNDHLEISVDRNVSSLPIFLSTALPALRSLSYTFDRRGYNGDLSLPFNAIAATHSNLTELTLNIHSKLSRRIRFSDVLAPLAPLQRLRVVNVTVKGEYLVYNANDLRKIPAMWPALVELRIAGDLYTQRTRSAAPLGALLALARALPELRALQLPQTLFTPGALDVAATTAAAAPHRALHGLRLGAVEVCGGREEDAEREVRAFLSALFPNAGHRVDVKTDFAAEP
ncbi:uncharacterized protein BXZ73DRAFT_103930 [Epithele typhae]|uniref:uncharacterized protein n=1 Tax=Epithele typhae TaxID=378194 RepID=UPI0020088A10|nr:uncharacterized protein BXZ73DRAFT_103930 [Epithele typhae]KAH9923132.1 hypothetical protein BXZ73DRAFT_103930 [Epithele typhae]